MKPRTFALSVAVAIGLVAGPAALPALAWDASPSATAYCETATGHVMLTATYTNAEPSGSSTVMQVTADHGLGTQTIAGGATGSFGPVDLGAGGQPAGTVRFVATWADGHEGSDERTASYEAVPSCSKAVYHRPTLSGSATCDKREGRYVVTYDGDADGGTASPAIPLTRRVPGTATSDSLTVTFSYPGGVTAKKTATVTLGGDCRRSLRWLLKLRMSPTGPLDLAGRVMATPGSEVVATIRRAPKSFTVDLVIDGRTVIDHRRFTAEPRRTTLRIRVGTMHIQIYARSAGKPAVFRSYSGAI